MTNERPGYDHVILGPMIGLDNKKNHRGMYIRTLQILDKLGPEGWVGENMVKGQSPPQELEEGTHTVLQNIW